MKLTVHETLAPGEYVLTRQGEVIPEPLPEPEPPPAPLPWLSVRFDADGPKQPLEGAVLDGDVWIEVEAEGIPGPFTFELDGTVVRTESNPPFDFQGGTASGGNPWYTTEVADGEHAIRCTWPGGEALAYFTVRNQVTTAPPPEPPVPLPPPPAATFEVESDGITFQFVKPQVTGEFVSGFPWVLGQCAVLQTLPGWDGGRGGAMVNPRFGGSGSLGYDVLLSYDEALRTRFPYALKPGESLVGTWSWRPGEPGCPDVISSKPGVPRPLLRNAAVLTCVATIPDPLAFRPAYSGLEKRQLSAATLIDLGTLPRWRLPSSAPSVGTVLDNISRLYLDHRSMWDGRYLHPSENMQDYGRDLAYDIGSALLMLCCDIDLASKRELAIAVCQLAIDQHGVFETGGHFDFGGGHGPGRRAPMVVAGHLLGDLVMKNFWLEHTNGKLTGESAQLGVDAQGTYWREWWPPRSGSTRSDPGSTSYRTCCTANVWMGHMMAIRGMGLVVEYDVPQAWAWMDAYQAESHSKDYQYAWKPWHRELWLATQGGRS